MLLLPYTAHVPGLVMVHKLRAGARECVRSGEDGSRGVPLAASAGCPLPLQGRTPAVLRPRPTARERLPP